MSIQQAEGDLVTAVQNVTTELASLSQQLQAAIASNNPQQLTDAANAIEAQVTALNNAVASASNPTPAPAPTDPTGGGTPTA